jgi:putative ABC transport system permease protein
LPGAGTAAIPDTVAKALDLDVGDSITCAFRHEEYSGGKDNYTLKITTLNITSTVSSIWTQPGFEDSNVEWFGTTILYKADSDIWLGLVNNPVILNIADYGQSGINRSSSTPLYSVEWNYFIWVDRDEVVRIADLPGSVGELNSIQNQLAKKLYPMGVRVSESGLDYTLATLKLNLGGQEPLFLALSLPLLALGIYLSAVGVDLGMTERRREAGILKSRGASDRQVFGSLMTEAAMLGAISGIAGLLVGALVSRFLLSAVASSGGEAVTQVTDFVTSLRTIVLCVLLGITLMIAASYGSFKRVSQSQVSHALHHYSPEATQAEYSAGPDLLLLAMAIWSLTAISLGSDWPDHLHLSWMAEVVADAIFLTGVAMLPLLPFILSLSLVRLLTRGSRRLYSRFAWFVKSWTKDLHYLVERNIVRNPRRASNLCVIISLALAFGLFISVSMESTMNYERENVRFDVGADIKLTALDTQFASHNTVDSSKLENVSALEGVEHAASYSELVLYFDLTGIFSSASSVVMDATDYLETVKPDDFFFVDGGSGLLQELATPGNVLLSADFAERTGAQTGDSIPLIISNGQLFNEQDVTVVGLVKNLPGLVGVEAFVDRATLSFSPDQNLTGLFYDYGAFIDVAAGSNMHEVALKAVAQSNLEGLACTSTILEDELDALEKEPTFASLAGFLYIEYALSILTMSVGVGLLIFVAVYDREKELACIVARGSSGRQLRKILMGESMSLMVVGLIVGTTVGLLAAYLFNSFYGQQFYSMLEPKTVFTFVSFSIVLSSIAALVLASLVATARAGKIKLAEVLRIRGG